MKNLYLLTLLFIGAYSSLYAQSGWKVAHNQNNVIVSYDIFTCQGKFEVFGVRVENNASNAQYIHFRLKVRDGNGPILIDMEFNKTLNANSSKVGDCSDPTGITGLNRFCSTPLRNPQIEFEIL